MHGLGKLGTCRESEESLEPHHSPLKTVEKPHGARA